jgi:hypothetical protein
MIWTTFGHVQMSNQPDETNHDRPEFLSPKIEAHQTLDNHFRFGKVCRRGSWMTAF